MCFISVTNHNYVYGGVLYGYVNCRTVVLYEILIIQAQEKETTITLISLPTDGSYYTTVFYFDIKCIVRCSYFRKLCNRTLGYQGNPVLQF